MTKLGQRSLGLLQASEHGQLVSASETLAVNGYIHGYRAIYKANTGSIIEKKRGYMYYNNIIDSKVQPILFSEKMEKRIEPNQDTMETGEILQMKNEELIYSQYSQRITHRFIVSRKIIPCE